MSWDQIPSWTCHRLREFYDEVSSTCSSRDTFVEIGVAYGGSLAYLCERLDNSLSGVRVSYGQWAVHLEQVEYGDDVRVFGIDIFQDHQGKDQLSPEVWARVTGHGNPMVSCRSEMELYCAAPTRRVTLIRDNGIDAADGFRDNSVDVLFVDEHHTFESVGGAINAWLPKVRAGGTIAGHDCNPHYPGVLAAVTKFLPSAEVRPPHPDDNGWGGVWVWKKP